MIYSLEDACSIYGFDDYEEDFKYVVVAITNRFEGGIEGGRYGWDIIGGTPSVGRIDRLARKVGAVVVESFLCGHKKELKEYGFENFVDELEEVLNENTQQENEALCKDTHLEEKLKTYSA